VDLVSGPNPTLLNLWIALRSLKVAPIPLLPSNFPTTLRDDHQRQAIHHGGPGGGDAAEAAMEFQRRFGRAELPHAQRLFL